MHRLLDMVMVREDVTERKQRGIAWSGQSTSEASSEMQHTWNRMQGRALQRRLRWKDLLWRPGRRAEGDPGEWIGVGQRATKDQETG